MRHDPDEALHPPLEAAMLLDGTTIEFHPICATEESDLERFHHTLSDRTTYLRFFSRHPELSVDELYRFTHVDHHDREAIVATADGEMIGIARFDRFDDTADAEAAFVVTDAWQGRGLGATLFSRLATRARSEGITRFVAQTLPGNSRMLGVFRHAGLPATFELRDGAVSVSLELGPEPAPDR